MATTDTITHCIFCGTERHFIYEMNGFSIHQCPTCHASSVASPPDDETIGEFYDGFAFETRKDNLERILTPEISNWFSSLGLPPNAEMLDVGGGAGFFAYAFQHFGCGNSSFIDLDPSACKFARDELGLKNVISADIRTIGSHYAESFDFIYCRHVIEHLVDPTEMINASLKLLKPGGLLLLQFPNGLSLEYFAFPERLKSFASKLMKSNGYSKFKTIGTLLSKSNAFGLDPIRHLWAIPPYSIQRYLKDRPDLSVTIRNASVTDPVFSPYFTAHNLSSKLKSISAKILFSRIRGGAHGIVEIRKTASN